MSRVLLEYALAKHTPLLNTMNISTRNLIEAIAELPNAIMADLETGSHSRNNVEAEEFNRRFPSLNAQLAEVARLAETVEDELPVELALCEATRICLRPDVTYRFTVRPGCKACADAAAMYADS